jgi:hypothetical protein
MLTLFRPFFWSSLQTPLRCIFYRKTCPPSKIPLGQLPIPHLLPKNLVLIPPPRPAIGTSKMRRIGVQPCKSTQTDRHCQAKTDACPSARSFGDIQGQFDIQFYPSSQIPSRSVFRPKKCTPEKFVKKLALGTRILKN